MPHTHLCINTNVIRKRSGQNLEVWKKQHFFGVWETLDRKYLSVRLHARTRGLNLAADSRVTIKLLSCRNIRLCYKLNKARCDPHYKRGLTETMYIWSVRSTENIISFFQSSQNVRI
jgi:hypothetical protein